MRLGCERDNCGAMVLVFRIDRDRIFPRLSRTCVVDRGVARCVHLGGLRCACVLTPVRDIVYKNARITWSVTHIVPARPLRSHVLGFNRPHLTQFQHRVRASHIDLGTLARDVDTICNHEAQGADEYRKQFETRATVHGRADPIRGGREA